MSQQARTPTLRRFRSLALVVYCLGLAGLALLPFDSVLIPELVIGGFALLAAVLVLIRARPGARQRPENYAYLIGGVAGLATALGYTFGATSEPIYTRGSIALVVLSGALAAYGAYLDPDPLG